MAVFILIISVLLSTIQLNFAKLPTLPDGYPIKEGHEAVYKYVLKSKVSMSVVQLGANYKYDVITKPGTESNQLYVAIENVEYDDSIDDPTQADIDALQIPFIVYLDEAGEWSKVKMSPKETAFSLDQKDSILSTLVFDMNDVNNHILGEAEVTEEELKNDIPLGESCKVQVYQSNTADEFSLDVHASRAQCTGDSDLGIDGFEITADSNISIKYEFDKNPLRFKQAKMTLDVTVGSNPKIKMRMFHTLEFFEFRPYKTNFNIENLTETYTESEFTKKLEQLKEAKEQN